MDQIKTTLKKPYWQVFGSLAISLFWVLFLWHFWQNGVYALGVNAFIFLLLVIILFGKSFSQYKIWQAKNWLWLIPIIFIALSFAIYNNPFIKVVNIFVWPILFVIFFNYSLITDREKIYWSLGFITSLFVNIFYPVAKIFMANRTGAQAIGLNFAVQRRNVAKSILGGLGLLILLALVIIIPLLSSADPAFAAQFNLFYIWLGNIISWEFIYKLVFWYILGILLIAAWLAWQKPHEPAIQKDNERQADSIVYGIVIGGVLLLYLLFLFIQIQNLWVRVLPSGFKDVEILIKSGFWQLMALSVVNIIIFFFTYKKTSAIVQGLLNFFTIASLLLLLSAGYRMALYVYFYGFSYEKFYASYTVIYCLVLFIYFLIKIVTKQKLNIIKFLLFTFLWMYGLISIFPTEQFIIRANVALAQQPQSRIDMYESRILSADVLAFIEQNSQQDFMRINHKNDKVIDWQSWVEKRGKTIKDKTWYELNLVDILYKANK